MACGDVVVFEGSWFDNEWVIFVLERPWNSEIVDSMFKVLFTIFRIF